MPTSKKRKRAGKVVQKQPFKLPENITPDAWLAKLNGAHFIYLRDEPDFRTMVKIGRAMNAIGFASQTISESMSVKTNLGRRQYCRGYFVLAGYLHQAIKITNGIKERYLTLPAFEPLRKIALDPEYKKARDYARRIRNFTAFHLDEFDEDDRTGQMLSTLKPTTYLLMGGDDNTFGSFYFHFSDHLDIAYLVEEFADGREWEETVNDLYMTILRVSFEFLQAAHDFQIALSNRMELKEYIYR